MAGFGSFALFTLISALLLLPSHGYLTLRRIGNAVSRGARCLDGSGAAYYLFRNTNSARWIIHLETGTSACFGSGAAFCNLFTNPNFGGSSLQLPCALPELQSPRLSDVGQLVSSDSRRNPVFYNDNRVFVPHCSGDLFTGRNVNGTAYGGVYFGGHHIVQAVLEDLLNIHGLGSATQVLFGGAAMGAVTHVEFARRLLPSSIQLAVYTDGNGLTPFPTFTDLQPTINESLVSGTEESLVQTLVLRSSSAVSNSSAGLKAIYDTVRIFDPYLPDACVQAGTTFQGLECLDVAVGAGFAVLTGTPVFVFASVWDTAQAALLLGLERYSCMAESGQLSAEEQVYMRILGNNNFVRLNTLYSQQARPISVFLAFCYTNTFLEDDLLCSLVDGRSPYQAMTFFIDEVLQGRQALLVDTQRNSTELQCSDSCGARQCSWGTTAIRTEEATANCTRRLDAFMVYRQGAACLGASRPQFAASSVPPSAMTRFNLVNATARDAVCLDGSPGGYYVQRNITNTNWVVHIQGGGFCSSPTECQQTATTSFGSSNSWTCIVPGQDLDGDYASVADVASGDSSINPAFSTWNRVFIRYCTADFYLGQNPSATNPFGVNTVGSMLLRSVFYDLTQFHGLIDGEVVIIGGTSAGGIAVHSSIDSVRDLLVAQRAAVGRSAPQVLGLSDGGWLRGVPSLQDFANSPATAFVRPLDSVFVQSFLPLISTVFRALQNPACSANRSAQVPANGGHECLFADIAWPFIQTPMFLISSHWDSRDILPRIGATRFACASITNRISAVERSFLTQYGEFSLSRAGVFQQDYDGFFFPTCIGHVHFEFAPEINIFPPCDDIRGTSAYNAFAEWVSVLMRGSGTIPRLVGDAPTTFQCDPSCLATQCAWATNPDTSNTTCPNLTPAQLSTGQYFVGQPCPAATPTPPTAPPAMQLCPEAESATADEERYRALLSCWSRSFAEYNAAFDRYTNGQCIGL